MFLHLKVQIALIFHFLTSCPDIRKSLGCLNLKIFTKDKHQFVPSKDMEWKSFGGE